MTALSLHGEQCPFCSVFRRFDQRFGRYGGYFLSDVGLKFVWSPRLVDTNLRFQMKSGAVKCGERGDHSKSPFFDIDRPRNNCFKELIAARAVCGVAPSC